MLRSLSTALLMAPAVLSILLWTPASAQQVDHPERRIFAGRSHDAGVVSPSAWLGYPLGAHLATYRELLGYFEQLAASSPRVVLRTHGSSYEGRPLVHAIISSPENIARLDSIQSNLARLADPRTITGNDQLEEILHRTPAAVMLVFATDGAETAGPEAGMHVAWQLAAATDSVTLEVLRNTVVIIGPAQNPDSNQRVVAWYNAFRVGRGGSADPNAAEHHFPWGFNSNNRYQIDMNRESVWGIQRETRANVALYRQWNPQVFVDNHGEYPVYTGPWYVEPLHEVLTQSQRQWLRRFGEAMAEGFAAHGYEYNPWDYGQFDPGYWDTYPNFSGAVAWTTETTGGGSRGIRLERPDGRVFTLADGIIQHVIASDITVRVASAQREQLLRDFAAYKSSAIEQGSRGPVRGYALSAHNDPHRLATVIRTLQRNAIEVHRTTSDARVSGRPFFEEGGNGTPAPRTVTLPAGSYVALLSQPESRMLQVLMEPEATMSPEFLQQVAAAQAQDDEGRAASRIFYDITAWAMPFTYHLEAFELLETPPTGVLAAVPAPPAGEATEEALEPRAGLLAEPNGELLPAAQVQRAAGRRIAVAMDRPVRANDYGHIWYTLERRFGLDFTAINFERLLRTDLSRYDVLILPDGAYDNLHAAVARDVASHLREWVHSGGTLIGMRGASAWITTEGHGITAARMRQPQERIQTVPGAIMRALVSEPEHSLLRGYRAAEFPVMVWSALAFDPDAPVEAPLLIADTERARISGFVFPESLQHVAGTPYVVRDRQGSGEVVLFLDDPLFRLFWDGLAQLFFNAILGGPPH